MSDGLELLLDALDRGLGWEDISASAVAGPVPIPVTVTGAGRSATIEITRVLYEVKVEDELDEMEVEAQRARDQTRMAMQRQAADEARFRATSASHYNHNNNGDQDSDDTEPARPLDEREKEFYERVTEKLQRDRAGALSGILSAFGLSLQDDMTGVSTATARISTSPATHSHDG
ncbi:hypothetical protein LY76DRAFT_687109 [Colletotrichum caudatum]|nr:hypothetical protein LY76DRAFT_687109 [Colletotrichum caudatum]